MLGDKPVQNYLRAATDNGQCDPRLRYTPSVLTLYGTKPLLMLRKLLSHMSKWADVRYEALPLTTDILRSIDARSSLGGHSSEAACIFNAICLGLQTGS